MTTLPEAVASTWSMSTNCALPKIPSRLRVAVRVKKVMYFVCSGINPCGTGLDNSPSARLDCQKTHSVSPLFFYELTKWGIPGGVTNKVG